MLKGIKCDGCVIVQTYSLTKRLNLRMSFTRLILLEKTAPLLMLNVAFHVYVKSCDSRSGMADWEITIALAKALGYEMNYDHPSEIMAEIASLTPSFTNVSYELIDELGSVQWPCNQSYPEGSPLYTR